MAKLNGILKIEGTLDNMTFYKSKDGHLVRTKGGVGGDRIKSDSAFARTRENNNEFGNAAKAGKLLRNTLRTMMMNAKDTRVTSRLTQVMSLVKNYDVNSSRGSRNVGSALSNPTALELLKNFDFNESAVLASVLYKPYTVTTGTGRIQILDIIPINDLAFPVGATNATFKGAFATVDFIKGTSAIEYTNEVTVPIDSTKYDIELTPAAIPAISGYKFYLLTIQFSQTVNGQQYSLKNGAYNTLSIIEVE